MALEESNFTEGGQEFEHNEYRQQLRSLVSAWDIDPNRVAAWKLGASTHASRSELQSMTLLFGPLNESQVITEVMDVPFGSANCLEVEIGIRFTNNFGFEWCWAIDFPSKVVFESSRSKWESLVDSHCGAGYLLLLDNSLKRGSFHLPEYASIELDSETYEMDFSRLLLPVLDTFAEFHSLSRGAGIEPPVDKWVALGGLTPCIPIHGGEFVAIREDGETVATFSVSGGAHSE